MKKKIISIVIALFLTLTLAYSQQGTSRDIIFKAMKDELARNMSNLALENLKKSFFISYNIHDFKVMSIKASLGAIVESDEKPYRELWSRIIVGDYGRTQENFFDPESGGDFVSGFVNDRLPLEDDYDGIRRVIWKSTDEMYKRAAETYEKKISAINQQKLSAEDSALADLFNAPVVNKKLPSVKFDFNKAKWELAAKELSAIFDKYSDIYKSEITITFIQGDEFVVNSEETETVYPFTLAAVQVNAYTQADDGEPLFDQVLYYEITPDDLPKLEVMKTDVKKMADNLTALRKAPSFTDSYTGPVLFEEQAVGEMFSQRLFSENEGLIVVRKLLYSDPKMLMFASQMIGKPLDDKIGKKILSDNLTIKSTPSKADFEGKKLIGSYLIDMEGVVPPNELILVENGNLNTILNSRIPTPKLNASNGSKRIQIQGSTVSSDIGPGVIDFTFTDAVKRDELKKKLIDKAKEEGLDYAIIVRKLKSPASSIKTKMDESSILSFASGMQKKGNVSKPIAIYKVSLTDGKEELLRSAELGGISLSTLKKITAASDKKFAYNTMLSQGGGISSLFSFAFAFSGRDNWNLIGIPSSFIIPDAVLIEEMDVQKEKRMITGKLPVVENPVGK
ncbi:MAG: hypothetical protein A2X61_04750 [Ignavibacteria bacterium GWB2_35_12]|nr:MAG: hypothetical protein A2X63_06060 [Ignavibacteria bacterium GWA2_35_8]OGU37730.1 MAG: hypothetical protein A2X61_04750 [Ignavibacteria bacterium GWB2_35_12]OGU88655.1 MAG: hypothetical protein A2220_00350 [Ignavibacteria bacterium RIFOXYA2_FULL_35_10]OGV23226.1 MAG: hypothetical protein A2475_13305 [Ignavibacteria bacterium RIFOXYC2_FULL_35_21]